MPTSLADNLLRCKWTVQGRDICLPLSGCGRLDREAREQERDEQNRVQPDAGVSWGRNSKVRFVEFHSAVSAEGCSHGATVDPEKPWVLWPETASRAVKRSQQIIRSRKQESLVKIDQFFSRILHY